MADEGLSNGLFRRVSTPPRTIGIWLMSMAILVFVMVILGGLTRLTQSGLSIVDWRPITGALPPMNAADWQTLFDQYKQFPEYRERNASMTVSEFKSIFWLEFIHRFWGRLIGISFIVPFVYFAMHGGLARGLMLRLGVLFLLGAAQGVLGWFMVQSGLVDRPDVSQYRLVAHLGLAVLLYGYLLWIALGYLGRTGSGAQGLQTCRRLGWVAAVWIFVTMLSGGFVAGLDAGLTYNTFPLMDGRWVPDGLLAQTPAYLNFFENVTTVQFDHRILAELLVLYLLGFWYFARTRLAGVARLALHGVAIMALVQIGLGIATLLFIVPVALAATHQAGAMILLSLALWLMKEIGSGQRQEENA